MMPSASVESDRLVINGDRVRVDWQYVGGVLAGGIIAVERHGEIVFSDWVRSGDVVESQYTRDAHGERVVSGESLSRRPA